MSQKGPCLIFPRAKGKEGRNTFTLARFFQCNLTIKIILIVVLLIQAPPSHSDPHSFRIKKIKSKRTAESQYSAMGVGGII